jgi:hypothetical protein
MDYKRRNTLLVIFNVLLLSLIISGCSTTGTAYFTSISGKVTPSLDYSPSWTSINPGIERLSFSQDYPPLVVEAIRVDLSNPDRKIIVTPGNLPYSKNIVEKNFLSQTTSSFLEEYDCLVAINATPFEPFRILQGKRQRAVGVVISNQILYSKNSKYDVFAVFLDKTVSLIEDPFIYNKAGNIEYAAGGFFIILENGENTGYKGDRYPRSLIGISEDARYLFLVVIDGEDIKRSIGASLFESAEWLKSLGALNAMALDGGGSSTLVIRGEDDKSVLLNKPSGTILISNERPVAVHIGVQ